MNTTPPQLMRRMLPRKDAAYYLGISLRRLDDLKANGHIVPVKIGGRHVYDKVDLDAYIEIQKAATA